MTIPGLICIVDDSVNYRLLVQQVFSRFLTAYPLRIFASGQALLEALNHLSPAPSLIVLDRHMPWLDGHQTLLALKQHPTLRTIPVVMMSTDASFLEIDQCYQAGVNSFLLKPVDINSVRKTMETLCQYWLELNRQPTAGLSRTSY
ncbi:response regulator [Spirosoma koreense]